MSARVTGFHEASVKVVDGSASLAASRMAAKDEVTTTRRTAGAARATARRRPVVPLTAGSIRSFWGSSGNKHVSPCSLYLCYMMAWA